MTIKFKPHSLETAPKAAKPLLEGAKKQLGFVPKLFGNLAESPETLSAYLQLSGLVDKLSFTPLEKQIVLITASIENGCEYCVAAHSTISDLQKLDRGVIDSLRAGERLSDNKLEVLRVTTQQLVEKRGWLSDADIQAFVDAGYSKGQLLELTVGIALKTISNYANHILGTEIDEAFKPRAWTDPDRTKRKAG